MKIPLIHLEKSATLWCIFSFLLFSVNCNVFATQLNLEDPLNLSFASDCRLTPTDFCNDIGWFFDSENISFRNTRLSERQIGPIFKKDKQLTAITADFHQSPVVEAIFANYIRLSFQPYKDISCQLEGIVYNSHSLVLRMRLESIGLEEKQLWAGLFFKSGAGHEAVEMEEKEFFINISPPEPPPTQANYSFSGP